MTFTSRAAGRRALVGRPDAARIPLARAVADQAACGPLTTDDGADLLATDLLDRRTGAILATTAISRDELRDEDTWWGAGPRRRGLPGGSQGSKVSPGSSCSSGFAGDAGGIKRCEP